MPEADRFGSKLVPVLLDNKHAPSIKGGRSLWGLHDPLVYSPGDRIQTITVRPGFVTDLASVPRWAWILVPPDGPWVKAAIIHNYLYATGGIGRWKKGQVTITRPEPYTRLEADQIMREAMANRGIGWFKRKLIYLAVRIGGQSAWRRNQENFVTPALERYIVE
jgi:hypothetical protein